MASFCQKCKPWRTRRTSPRTTDTRMEDKLHRTTTRSLTTMTAVPNHKIRNGSSTSEIQIATSLKIQNSAMRMRLSTRWRKASSKAKIRWCEEGVQHASTDPRSLKCAHKDKMALMTTWPRRTIWQPSEEGDLLAPRPKMRRPLKTK